MIKTYTTRDQKIMVGIFLVPVFSLVANLDNK